MSIEEETAKDSPDNGEDIKEWYVIQVAAGAEKQIAAAIAKRIEQFGMQDSFGGFLMPTESLIEVRRGEKVTVKKPILSGYILIRMRTSDKKAADLVRRTPNVRKFVSPEMGVDPTPLSMEELQPIMEYSEDTAKTPGLSVTFEVGESVEIADGGPFHGWTGHIDEIDEKHGRVKVLIGIFGRPTPMEFTYDQVKRNVV